MITCSVCSKEGHNARTCPSRGAAAKSSPAPKAGAKAKAPKAAAEPASVVGQLEQRAAKLRGELVIIERVIADLRTLESEVAS